jgi:lysophospholipase L1-like esterase
VLGIVSRSRDLLWEQYGTKLIVLLWDLIPSNNAEDARWLAAALKSRSVEVIRVSDILPDLGEARYYIPDDGHPNGAAYRAVAEKLMPFVGDALAQH